MDALRSVLQFPLQDELRFNYEHSLRHTDESVQVKTIHPNRVLYN